MRTHQKINNRKFESSTFYYININIKHFLKKKKWKANTIICKLKLGGVPSALWVMPVITSMVNGIYRHVFLCVNKAIHHHRVYVIFARMEIKFNPIDLYNIFFAPVIPETISSHKQWGFYRSIEFIRSWQCVKAKFKISAITYRK